MMQQGNKPARLQLRLHEIHVIRMSGSVSKSFPYMAAELAAGLLWTFFLKSFFVAALVKLPVIGKVLDIGRLFNILI